MSFNFAPSATSIYTYLDTRLQGIENDLATAIAALSSAANPSTIGIGGATPSGSVTLASTGDATITATTDDLDVLLRRVTSTDVVRLIMGEGSTQRVRWALDGDDLTWTISDDGIDFNTIMSISGASGRVNLFTLVSQSVANLGTASNFDAGTLKYASDGRKAGEGVGSGTGVLVFCDGSAWIACDTGATVAA